MGSKVDRAIAALRECADALDAMPIRRVSYLGVPFINPGTLRDEAAWMEEQKKAWEKATEINRTTIINEGSSNLFGTEE